MLDISSSLSYKKNFTAGRLDQESLCTIFKQFNLFSKSKHPSRKEEIQNSLLNALEYGERQLGICKLVRDKSKLNWIFTLSSSLTRLQRFYHLYEVAKCSKTGWTNRLSSRLAQLISKSVWFLTDTEQDSINKTQGSGIQKHLGL